MAEAIGNAFVEVEARLDKLDASLKTAQVKTERFAEGASKSKVEVGAGADTSKFDKIMAKAERSILKFGGAMIAIHASVGAIEAGFHAWDLAIAKSEGRLEDAGKSLDKMKESVGGIFSSIPLVGGALQKIFSLGTAIGEKLTGESAFKAEVIAIEAGNKKLLERITHLEKIRNFEKSIAADAAAAARGLKESLATADQDDRVKIENEREAAIEASNNRLRQQVDLNRQLNQVEGVDSRKLRGELSNLQAEIDAKIREAQGVRLERTPSAATRAVARKRSPELFARADVIQAELDKIGRAQTERINQVVEAEKTASIEIETAWNISNRKIAESDEKLRQARIQSAIEYAEAQQAQSIKAIEAAEEETRERIKANTEWAEAQQAQAIRSIEMEKEKAVVVQSLDNKRFNQLQAESVLASQVEWDRVLSPLEHASFTRNQDAMARGPATTGMMQKVEDPRLIDTNRLLGTVISTIRNAFTGTPIMVN